MQNKEKVILLDFCETVVKFQTADYFVEYVVDKKKTNSIIIRKFFYQIINHIGLVSYVEKRKPSYSFNKRCILSFLKGLSELELNKLAKSYYDDVLKPGFITQTINQIRLWQNQGYRIIILSGGYDIYLRYFAEEFGISDIVCTSIKFCGGSCKGTFSTIDCLGRNKIIMLERYLHLYGIQIDTGNSIAVSDSISDLPMLDYVGQQLIVCHKNKRKWYQDYGYENCLLWD